MRAKYNSTITNLNKNKNFFGILYCQDETEVKAQFTRKYDNDPLETVTKVEIKFKLPASIVPAVWYRHGLNIKQIIATLNFFPSKIIWQLGLLLGLNLSTSTIKIAYSNSSDIQVSSKVIAIRKITTLLRKIYKSGECRLSTEYPRHVPLIPIIDVNDIIFEKLITMIPLKQSIFRTLTNCGGNKYMYKGKMWLPLEVEKDKQAVMCSRLIRIGECKSPDNNCPISARSLKFHNFMVGTETIMFKKNTKRKRT